jgi:hypothetical protein
MAINTNSCCWLADKALFSQTSALALDQIEQFCAGGGTHDLSATFDAPVHCGSGLENNLLSSVSATPGSSARDHRIA